MASTIAELHTEKPSEDEIKDMSTIEQYMASRLALLRTQDPHGDKDKWDNIEKHYHEWTQDSKRKLQERLLPHNKRPDFILYDNDHNEVCRVKYDSTKDPIVNYISKDIRGFNVDHDTFVAPIKKD